MSRIRNFLSLAGRTVKVGIKTLVVAHLIDEYIGTIVMTQGPSMEPTLSGFNFVYVDKLFMAFSGIKTGDIVISRSVHDPNKTICKRVGAVPGQLMYFGHRIFQIPEGHVWLQGDNFHNSTDSRKFGPVPLGLVRGRVVCTLYPQFKILSREVPEL